VSVAVATFDQSPLLPWTPATQEERRFRRILTTTLALLMLLGVLMPFLPVSQLLPPPPADEPKTYVKLLLPPKPVEPTPAPKVQAPTAKQAEIKQQPSPKPAPAPASSPAPQKEGVGPASAREQAKQAGILAMSKSLEALRDDPSAGRLDDGPLTNAGGNARKVERSVLTSKVSSGSEGINVSELSRGVGPGGGGGAVGLGTRSTTQVESPIGVSTDGAGGGRGQRHKMASRTDEEIQLVFDRNKGAIFGIYNRALRTDPALQGKMVLRLTIAPSGEVTDIGVVSSELGDQALERKLTLRIKQFNFGAKEVETVTVTYPIEFFPS
jgi:protein TonB